MDRRAEIWTAERLEQAAIDELLRHGGNKRDAALLRQQFRQQADEEIKLIAAKIPE